MLKQLHYEEYSTVRTDESSFNASTLDIQNLNHGSSWPPEVFDGNWNNPSYQLQAYSATHRDSNAKLNPVEKMTCCPLCPYKANRPSAVQKHMYTHTKEKPFSCNFCQYSCTQSVNLRRHIARLHANETLLPI